MDLMKSKTAVFCVLAKNCATNLKRNIRIIDMFRRYFQRAYVVVVENDSKDNSAQIADAWAYTDSFVKVTHPIIPENIRQAGRIARITFCRNIYLQCIRDLGQLDYVIVIDGDLILEQVDLESVIADAPSDWVAICANGRYFSSFMNHKIPGAYYDSFAYVSKDEQDIYRAPMKFKSYRGDLYYNLHNKDYFECFSAFGGIAIYRWEDLCDYEYVLMPNAYSALKVLCEHVPLNKLLNRRGKVYICNRLKVWRDECTFIESMYHWLIYWYSYMVIAKRKR